MAQSALTVTTPNPTPPTNFSFTGATPPNPPNFTRQSYANPFNMTAVAADGSGGRPQAPYGVNPNPPPFFDDGVGASVLVFAGNTAALASGVSANDTGTGTTISTAATGAGGEGVNSVAGTYGGNPNPFNAGLVPASASLAHEGAGTETLFTQTYNAPTIYAPVPLQAVGCGPALAAAPTMPQPNASHASSLSPTTNPTLTTIAPTTSVHNTAQITMTATGVGFTRQSQIVIGGVPQKTTFVSSTSLTCLATPPVAIPAPAAVPVTVVTGGVVTTAAQSWTIT